MIWQTILFVCAATIILLIVARFVNQLVMKTSMTDALINKDNPAFGVQVGGYLLGVILIITAVLSGPGHKDIMVDVMWVLIYGIVGIILLALIALWATRIILSAKCLESIRQGNVAAAIAMAGAFIGTGAVISATVTGESTGSWVPTMVFFVAGIIAFFIITYVYRLLTSYDDVKEILENNIPAAMSYAGMMIAVGLIVGNAIKGNFITYEESFKDFGYALIVVVALYPVRQWVVQGLLLGGGFSLYGGRLDSEISKDRNMNAGVIEAITYIGTALLVVGIL
jgi:uncharacterized membrane protein YjfL (UPF0719 family)